MKLVGVISTAVLSLILGVAAPVFAQEQHEQEEQKSKPAAQEENKGQPEKSAKQQEKPAAQPEKNAKQEEKNNQPAQQNAKQQEKNNQPAEKNVQQQQHATNQGGGRIPEDRYKANFGQQHRFRVSQAEYGNRRFQYSGYWFGFVDPWPSNWLYTQDVYVVEINGVYYLCNASYPGVNLVLSFTL